MTRNPVFCFLAGRSDVGVAARDPTAELPSPGKEKAIGETVLSKSSFGRLLAERVALVVTEAARDWRVRLVVFTGVVSRSAAGPPRIELSWGLRLFVTLRAVRRRSQNDSSSSSGIGAGASRASISASLAGETAGFSADLTLRLGKSSAAETRPGMLASSARQDEDL